MPTIPVGSYENVLKFQRIGAPRLATWTLGTNSTAGTTLDPNDHAAAVWDSFTNVGGPYVTGAMIGNWQFIGVTTTLMDDTGPVVGEYNQTISGSAAGLGLVPNTALLIKKNTASGGRRNRGRMYVPPVWPPETKVDGNGVIDSGEVTTLQNQYNSAFADLVTNNCPPMLFHSEAPFTATAITGFTVQSLMATQRRRLRK